MHEPAAAHRDAHVRHVPAVDPEEHQVAWRTRSGLTSCPARNCCLTLRGTADAVLGEDVLHEPAAVEAGRVGAAARYGRALKRQRRVRHGEAVELARRRISGGGRPREAGRRARSTAQPCGEQRQHDRPDGRRRAASHQMARPEPMSDPPLLDTLRSASPIYCGMEQTLLLNATYEPLKVVHWQKAITLWCQGKVEVISVYDREVRSVSVSFKLPSVIRLLRYIRIKKPFRLRAVLAREHLRARRPPLPVLRARVLPRAI